MVDFTSPQALVELGYRVREDIDQFAAKAYDDGHRTHLGASLIGRDCSRYLWYVYRWVYHKKHDGRMQRLFQRGHHEEARFVEYLRGIGCEVNIGTVRQDGTLEQLRVTGCGGHFGGSLDALIDWRDPYPQFRTIGEFKTNGPSPTFTKMVTQGVALVKPEHFAQQSIYGYKLNIEYGAYFMVNKSDENLHVEFKKLDFALAQRLESKAERIILSPTPPPKLSESITFETCKYCDMRGVCHQGEPYEKNCRSCRLAQPIDGAQWYCNGWQGVIPKHVIANGCENWQEAR